MFFKFRLFQNAPLQKNGGKSKAKIHFFTPLLHCRKKLYFDPKDKHFEMLSLHVLTLIQSVILPMQETNALKCSLMRKCNENNGISRCYRFAEKKLYFDTWHKCFLNKCNTVLTFLKLIFAAQNINQTVENTCKYTGMTPLQKLGCNFAPFTPAIWIESNWLDAKLTEETFFVKTLPICRLSMWKVTFPACSNFWKVICLLCGIVFQSPLNNSAELLNNVLKHFPWQETGVLRKVFHILMQWTSSPCEV